jgi:hypothetical protein
LKEARENWSFETQRLVIYALTTLHNFIHMESIDEIEQEAEDQFQEEDDVGNGPHGDGGQVNLGANALRDQIADDMWRDYRNYIARNINMGVNGYLHRV